MHSIPATLFETVGTTPNGRAWLDSLVENITAVSRRWDLRVGNPIEKDVSCAWVAPCTTSDGTPAILKLGYPHMEGRDEISGLEFWDGDPTVRLLRAEPESNAMLLERCTPGDSLRLQSAERQDVVIAGLLRRLWRPPSRDHRFRPLLEMIEHWSIDALGEADRSDDRALVERATEEARSLLESTVEPVVLATDLHAGNSLRCASRGWVVIDPKPFVGDRCYDATQHLFNCRARMAQQPIETVKCLADLLDLDSGRLHRWTFVRFALHRGTDVEATADIARQLANA